MADIRGYFASAQQTIILYKEPRLESLALNTPLISLDTRYCCSPSGCSECFDQILTLSSNNSLMWAIVKCPASDGL